MSPATAPVEVPELADECLLLTNPVWCLDRLVARWRVRDGDWIALPYRLPVLLRALLDKGVRMPRAAIDRWSELFRGFPTCLDLVEWDRPSPGVVGIVTDKIDPGLTLVVPLTAERGAEWQADPTLPFRPATVLQDLLLRVVFEHELPHLRAVPERFAFSLHAPLGTGSDGPSMHIAGVLAVLREASGRPPLLDRACAVVQPDGGRLVPVGKIELKLAAFVRECGTGSLLVRGRGCAKAAAYDAHFERVWEVDSLSDLAKHLHDAGLLSALVGASGHLTRPEAARVLDRLRWLVLREHRYRDAATLADRVSLCGFADPPDPAVCVEFASLHAQACRHHGRFADAVAVGLSMHERVTKSGELGCDDEEADAAAEYAASLFSGHRFADVPPLLCAWAEATFREPRRFRPLTRVKVWNTLGRALAILKEDGWDEMFGRSLALHRRRGDQENITRTSHYRVHARLRHADTTGAREALSEASGLGESAGAGNTWVAFLHANLARLENREWADEVLEPLLTRESGLDSLWLYAQATGRQTRRKREDTLARLELAVRSLRHQAGGVDGNVCNLFATFLELSIAARSEDTPRWATALTAARGFLAGADDHRVYYGPTVDGLPATPSLAAVETLLGQVPYF